MTRAFQVFRRPAGRFEAIPSGAAPGAFLLPWLWAFRHRLWLRGVGFLMIDAMLVFFAVGLAVTQPVFLGLAFIVPRLVAMTRGSAWLAAAAESRGWEYVGEIAARGSADAVAQVSRRGGTIPAELRPGPARRAFELPPRGLQRCWAVARLTIRSAFRYRLVVVLAVLLLGAVVMLPMVIKHDGTAQGFTQILLTYTLSVITALLSLVTLWLACGTLARDIDECQMQTVATKPVPRWQIWLGKWIGIMTLNAILLGMSTGTVYLLMQWRASRLPTELQQALRENVLTARASAQEPVPDFDAEADQLVRARMDELTARGVDLKAFRSQARELIQARHQLVPSGYFRRYQIDLGRVRDKLRDQPMFVRLKFYTPELSAKHPYDIELNVGPPESAARRTYYRSLAAEAAHEIAIEPNLLDEKGVLVVDIANRSESSLIFPFEDGFEVLYREGSFGLNYVRGVMVIFCWLALLAAIGLSAASFLSFPVAAFLATAILVVGLSSGTMKTVVADQTILGVDHESGKKTSAAIDRVAVPVFQGLLAVVNLIEQFKPIDSLSSGRSVSWGQLGRAIIQVVLFLGGIFAAIGIGLFTRRELATAQSQH